MVKSSEVINDMVRVVIIKVESSVEDVEIKGIG